VENGDNRHTWRPGLGKTGAGAGNLRTDGANTLMTRALVIIYNYARRGHYMCIMTLVIVIVRIYNDARRRLYK
jgi:hypothetical protein